MTPQMKTFYAWALSASSLPFIVPGDAAPNRYTPRGAWRAAQTQLAGELIPQPGGTLLTAAEIDAEIAAAEALGASYLRTLLFLLAQRIEAAVLQKQRALFAASLAQEETQ